MVSESASRATEECALNCPYSLNSRAPQYLSRISSRHFGSGAHRAFGRIGFQETVRIAPLLSLVLDIRRVPATGRVAVPEPIRRAQLGALIAPRRPAAMKLLCPIAPIETTRDPIRVGLAVKRQDFIFR